jgi:hypothetical protein
MATTKSHSPAAQSSGRRRIVTGLIGFICLAALAVWWLWPADFSNDPRVVEIRQLQEEARQRFAAGGGPTTMAEARDYVASVDQIRQKVEELPPQLRRAAGSGSRNFFFASMRQRIDDYYQAPPAQRPKLLDQHIKQSDLMRKAFEEARAAREAAVSSAGQQQQAGNADSGRSRWANRSQDERNEWFKNRILDRTSPEQRARYVEYRRAATERREELGLPRGWP